MCLNILWFFIGMCIVGEEDKAHMVLEKKI